MRWEKLLAIKRDGNAIVVVITSSQVRDSENVEAAQEKLLSLLSESQQHMIIDLGNVLYLSSAALSLFVTVNKRVKKSGGRSQKSTSCFA